MSPTLRILLVDAVHKLKSKSLQSSSQAMSKACEVSKNSEIIRNHAVEIFEIFTTSKETAMGLMLRLYQSKIMDKKTKSALFSSAFIHLQHTANALLEY